MKKLVVFGTGKISDVLADYFQRDSNYEVVAYTTEAAHVTGKEHHGHPWVPFDEVERQFPPATHAMHIAVGYHQLNRVRERLLKEARAKGYQLPSFVSSRSWPGPGLACGDNCFVADGVSVEPGARVGENVALWSNVRLETTLQFLYLKQREHDPEIWALLDVLHHVWISAPAAIRETV